MNHQLLRDLFQTNQPIHHMTTAAMANLFANSLLLGLILTFLTYVTMTPLIESTGKTGDELKKIKGKIILGSSNILFLCVGLTGIMILVNNNLARALSIGATLGLIRFRVKLGHKNLGSNLLFGIIVGIACGLQELQVAWLVAGVFIILQTSLFLILRKSAKDVDLVQ